MLRIRLSMGGVRKRPIYKIVIADGRYPRDGRFIEKIGSYNPLLPKDKKERIKIEAERVKIRRRILCRVYFIFIRSLWIYLWNYNF